MIAIIHSNSISPLQIRSQSKPNERGKIGAFIIEGEVDVVALLFLPLCSFLAELLGEFGFLAFFGDFSNVFVSWEVSPPPIILVAHST